jgi:hypothetical protein
MEMRPGPRRGHLARTIPPATRRAVLHRDGHRCKVPGCTNRLWLDVHHTHELCRGGDHREEMLISLCSTHHGLVHDGLMAVWLHGERVFFAFLDGRRAEAPLRRGKGATTTGRRSRLKGAGAAEPP